MFLPQSAEYAVFRCFAPFAERHDPAQRSAYRLLHDSDYAIGLFWGADVRAYPKSEFPSAPCAPGQSLDVCTAIQLNAFKQKIAFHPSD
jgi:hypothetical protein